MLLLSVLERSLYGLVVMGAERHVGIVTRELIYSSTFPSLPFRILSNILPIPVTASCMRVFTSRLIFFSLHQIGCDHLFIRFNFIFHYIPLLNSLSFHIELLFNFHVCF